MERVPTEISSGATSTSTTTATETRTLRDVVHNSKRSGGGYGSLAKSQTQPTFYICHKTESDDTLQRLALKYTVNVCILFGIFLLFFYFLLKVQEIKRVNKLWSDAELGLREHLYIPVNQMQLSTLQTIHPNLEIVQSLSPSTNQHQKTTDDTNSSMRSSDSTNSIPSTTTTNNSSYQDYLSKIDQQIRLTKNSLQSLDIKDSQIDTNPSETTRTATENNQRHKGSHNLSGNNVFVNVTTQNTRDKHVSAALKRIQQEKEDFDEL